MKKNNKTLLAVEVSRLTGTHIEDLKKKYLNQRYFDENVLPRYVLDDNGLIKESTEFFYYNYPIDKTFTLFNAYTADKLLESEISNAGLVELFNESPSLFEYFDKLPGLTHEDFYSNLRAASYLIVDLVYWGYGEDFESSANIVGVMKDLKIEIYEIAEKTLDKKAVKL
jgi:hypothetical protein